MRLQIGTITDKLDAALFHHRRQLDDHAFFLRQPMPAQGFDGVNWKYNLFEMIVSSSLLVEEVSVQTPEQPNHKAIRLRYIEYVW